MTDPTMNVFEARLIERLQAYGDVPVRSIDELAIARAAASARESRWFSARFGRSQLASPVAVALLLLTLLAALLAVFASGIWPRSLFAVPDPIATPTATPGSSLSTTGTQTTLESAGALPIEFSEPIVLVLPDGRLLMGGYGGGSSIAVLFDPAQRTSRAVESGFESVSLEGATSLDDGRVFLLGWEHREVVTTGRTLAWIFDPSTNQLSAPIPTLEQRFEAAVARLADGRVFVSGGLRNPESATTLASSEIFDPASGTFSVGVNLSSPRMAHQSIALAGGDLLFVGGDSVDAQNVGSPIGAIERFNPSTGANRTVGTLATGRGSPTIVELPDHRWLVVPAESPGTCGRHGIDPVMPLMFDPTTDAVVPALPLPHAIRVAVPLPDGRVVLAGSWQAIPGGCASGGTYVTNAWIGIYHPATGKTVETRDPITGEGNLPIVPTVRYDAGALLLDGRVALIAADVPPTGLDLLTIGSP